MQDYKTARNAMITKYRENPSRYLSFLEASKTLSGSLEQLAGIWAFLDSWGIINYTASDTAEADTAMPQATDAGDPQFCHNG